MVADFEDYAELHGGVTADSIRTAADDPRTHTATVRSLISDLADDDQRVSANVEGDIDDSTRMNLHPATEAARRLTQNGAFAIGLLNKFAETVQTFDSTVDDINADLHTRTNQRWSAQVHSPEHHDGGGGDEPTFDEIKAQVKAELQPRYDRALNTLEDEADSIAGKFEAGPSLADAKALVLAGYIPLEWASAWPTMHLTGAERQQAQINTVKNMTADEQVEYVRTHQDIDPKIADVLRPEAQETLADDVSKDIKDSSIDADTVKVLTLLKGQAPFAHELYTTVTPDDLSKAINKLSDDTYKLGDEPNKDQVKLYQDFLTGAGATFATFTKVHEGPYKSPDNLVDQWYDSITEDRRDGHAAALTLLIRAGGQDTSYDPHFLSDLTGKLYDWEKGHHGDPVWGPLESGGQGLNLVNPFLTGDGKGETYMSTDGLANMLGAMEHTPQAAHDFFDAGYPDGDHTKENERLHYLLTERTFSDGSASSDEGAGLGVALEAASVGSRDTDQKWSAHFTQEVFQTIADKSGTGDGWGPDDVWHIWPGMAEHLGNIGASYSDDVYDIVAGSPHPGDDHLQMSRTDLDKVLGEIGRGDKSGVETLSAAVMLEGNDRLQTVIDQWKHKHPGETLDLDNITDKGLGQLLGARADITGQVLGHIVNHSITVDAQDQSLAETRAAYVSKAIDIAGGFIPGAGSVLGEGAHELLKAGYDVGKSEGLDLLKDAVASTEPATGDAYKHDQRSDLSTVLSNNVTSQLIRSGIIQVGDGSDQIPESLTSEGPNHTRVLNPDIFDADGTDTLGKKGDYTEAQRKQILDDLYKWSNRNASLSVGAITHEAQNGLDRELNK